MNYECKMSILTFGPLSKLVHGLILASTTEMICISLGLKIFNVFNKHLNEVIMVLLHFSFRLIMILQLSETSRLNIDFPGILEYVNSIYLLEN